MKLVALISTWLGVAIVGLWGWVVPWVTSVGRDGPIYRAGEAARDLPDRAGLGAINALYAGSAWLVIGGLIAAFGLFAMFTTRADRWIAVAGYLLGAAFLGVGAFGTFGAELGGDGLWPFIGAIAAALIMLVMAVLSFRRAAFFGALPAALAALVGLGWSTWFMLDVDQTDALSVSWLGWALPVAHFLALFGALASIAVAGQNKTADPPPAPAASPATV